MSLCRSLLVAPLFLATLLSAPSIHAAVKLPGIFGDHMVLQRNIKLPIWGWAAAGEKVSVQLGGAPALSTTADATGKWRVELPALPAGGPHELSVSGTNTIKVQDILIGEVWVCSGQSNMEFAVNGVINAPKEIAAANLPTIRHIKVPLKPASVPQEDFTSPWQVCSPQTVGGFTAAGYFMARELQKQLGDVPIGLINASWGGTLIEPWTPLIGFAEVPKLQNIHENVLRTLPESPAYRDHVKKHLAEVEAWAAKSKEALAANQQVPVTPLFPEAVKPLTSHQSPTTLFNAMVNPFVGYPICGAIWYQGESNHVEGSIYTEKMKALIGGWRKLWGQGDFPFYYVQIAPFKYGAENPYILPQFWQAQLAAQSIPNTGMVVTSDIGDVNDIHPRNKQEVGRRLALLALHHTYGKKEVIAYGPTFKSLTQEGGQLRVTFDHADGELSSRDQKTLNSFEIIGEDTDFVPAKAMMEGASVLLSAPEVKKPVAMRFGWHKEAQPNLINGAGLPAVAFQAGQIPKIDYLALKVPDASAYKLVYDLDLSKLGTSIAYDADFSASLKGAFDRVAYFIELRDQSGKVNYCYVSMDAFTDDLKKIGIPTVTSGAFFQIPVKGMKVISSVSTVPSGDYVDGGNIEFWPHNYGPLNVAKVAGASDSVFDHGDQTSDPVAGYGSMQVHHPKAGSTIFAINHWVAGPGADLGIGNSSVKSDSRDWTFAQNAASYASKRLRVLVRMK